MPSAGSCAAGRARTWRSRRTSGCSPRRSCDRNASARGVPQPGAELCGDGRPLLQDIAVLTVAVELRNLGTCTLHPEWCGPGGALARWCCCIRADEMADDLDARARLYLDGRPS